MKRITIERYRLAKDTSPFYDDEFAGTPAPPPPFSGLVEGEADDGTRWVMWLDEIGHPVVFWPEREEDGAVIGKGIDLTREGQREEQEKRNAKSREILSDPDPAAAVKRYLYALDLFDTDDPKKLEDIRKVKAWHDERTTPDNDGGKPKGARS